MGMMNRLKIIDSKMIATWKAYENLKEERYNELMLELLAGNLIATESYVIC